MLGDRLSRALLTHSQEIALATRVVRLREAEEARVLLHSDLGREPSVDEWALASGLTRKELAHVIRGGRLAKQELIVCNLRLVLSVAHRYRNRGASLSDLVQEGVIALSRATEKFDPSRGHRFSTYATWWIRQRIQRCAVYPNTLSKVRIEHYSLARKAEAEARNYNAAHGEDPSTSELASALDVTEKQLTAAMGAVRPVYSVDYSQKLKKASYELIKSHDKLPEDVCEAASLRNSLDEVMKTSLSERELTILRMRCGLDDGRGKSLREIGETLDIVPRVVRRAEQKAYGKLRRTVIGVGLRSYLSSP